MFWVMAYSDMSSEFDRLTSFITWPRRNECFRTVSLAKAGFYYTGEGDKLRCFSCDGEVSNWREDMLPDEEHRARFPHCRLVRGDETHNRPTARLGNPRPLLMAPQLHAPSLPSPRPSFLVTVQYILFPLQVVQFLPSWCHRINYCDTLCAKSTLVLMLRFYWKRLRTYRYHEDERYWIEVYLCRICDFVQFERRK